MPPTAPPEGIISSGEYIQDSNLGSLVRIINEIKANGRLAPSKAGTISSFHWIFKRLEFLIFLIKSTLKIKVLKQFFLIFIGLNQVF